MAIIKSFSPFQNLSNFQTFLVDENPNSDYFRISEFTEQYTGGKNGFLIEGSEFLKETTEVKIEVLDVEGNPVYFEPGDGIPEYYEGTSKLVSVHVYDDTPIGLGKITILGELKNYIGPNGETLPVPEEWRGIYNVKWERTFKINKNLANETIVRFYKRPLVSIDELVKPIFTKSVNQVTDTGEVSGVAQLPNAGTDLTNYRGGTFYKLIKSSGTWDIDVDENTIDVNVDGSTYSSNIIEVLNDRELLVNIPYTNDNNIVDNFTSQSYSVTYTDFQRETIGESALTGSFAKIDITQLKTFVGDVARVKVFRKSRSSANDFQFVQESRLESTELLRDITTTENTELSYGRFDQTNLERYWVTTSIDHPTEIDSSVLSQAVKIDYNGSGIQQLITSQSFSISKDVEYTLNFRTLLSGSISDDKYLKAYFSGAYDNGSPFTQSFVDVTPDGSYVVRKSISENIIAQQNVDAKLVFEFKGDDWYISNVSLKNAQDTSFSPDEFTLIQDIPRKLASETFDFRFEFYDINNNYIPVNVVATKTFNGGNDFNTTSKLLTFESDRNAFRYISGSASPTSQQIQFKTTIQNLTGSVAYFSSAFDEDGVYIEPTDWVSYPGGLTNPSNNGGLVTIGSFEGTWGGVDPKPEVFSIIYTASIEELEEFETIYRLEDGENAPTLLVSSNANQFIYEPTTLSPKPSGQSITIRAQRKNLASIDTPITINKSNVNGPDLVEVSTESGVTTYTLSALQFSASFAENNFDEITYEFTGSDVFGVEQSDEITISKVINFDGVSVVLSTENTSFKSDSIGNVTSTEFDNGDGTVDVRIGSNVISHSEGLGTKNTFDIVSVTPSSGVTPNDPNPDSNSYGISAMSGDSGDLTLLIRYKAGDNATEIDFTKKVNYSKSKIAAPLLSIETSNKDQSVVAKSTGEQTGSFSNSIVVVKEQYEGSSSNKTITNLDAISSDISSIVTDELSGTITLSGRTLGDNIDSTTVAISATVEDSEGTPRTITDTIALSKVKKAAPNVLVTVSPQSQTIDFGSTPSEINISVKEGTTNYTYLNSGAPSEYQFTIESLSSEFSVSSLGVITADTSPSTTVSGTATINYVNSEGTSDSEDISFTIGVAKQGVDGLGAVTIELNPPSQEVSVDVNDIISDTNTFSVQVYDSLGLYTYDATLSTNGTFKITNLTDSNGDGTSSNSDGTITAAKPASVLGNLITFDVTYKDRDGNESDAIEKTHSIRVIAEGSTGPGIVFTGPWNSSRTYQYDISNGRRDAVLYDGRYYATLQSNTNQVPTSGGNTFWQDLGTEDFFVAAKIAIFDESFVRNTLNIGSNNSGALSSANITLYGGDNFPYFSLGQSNTQGNQGYSVGDGIFIGRDGDGEYKMSLENGNTNYLKWTGTTLEIKGNISATTGTISDTVTIGGTTAGNLLGPGDAAGDVNSNTTTIQGNKIRTGNIQSNSYSGVTDGSNFSTNGTNFDLTGGTITTPSFRIDSSGDAFFAGNISAGANITGANITGGVINGTTFVGAEGTFSGEITSTLGNIGGWIITSDKIYKPNQIVLNAARPAIEIQDGTTIRVDLNSSANLSALGATTAGSVNVPEGTVYDGDTRFSQFSNQTTFTGTLEDSYDAGTISTSGLSGQTLTFAYDSIDNQDNSYPSNDASLSANIVLEIPGQNPSSYYMTVGNAQISCTIYLQLIDSGGNVAAQHVQSVFNGVALDLVGSTQSEVTTRNFVTIPSSRGPQATTFNANGGTYTVRSKVLVTYNIPIYSSIFLPNGYFADLTIEGRGAGYSNVRVFKEVSVTEINGGGLQVVRTTTEYVRMDRQASGTMVEVGGNITATGNITAYYSSDKRLKDNIIPINNPFDKINKIGGYEFDWRPEYEKIHNSKGHDVGVIAQEIKENMPELVGDMYGGYMGVKYEKLTVYLLEAVKNLNNRLIELEEENKNLKKDK